MALRSIFYSAVAALALYAAPASAASCIGNCGTLGEDGVVTLPPSGGSSYDFVTTFLGQDGAGQLPGAEGTNGSELLSTPFFAAAADTVEFYFNYVTSDGHGFADYAWSQLRKTSGETAATIFTARTKPEGTIVPGQDLPGVEAILVPTDVPIIPGGPVWSPLGDSSGECFGPGCGYTGWIKSTFTVAEAGSYQLAFGVTNSLDNALDSGLAFAGILVGGSVLGDGGSFEDPLLPSDLNEEGGFEFSFVATPNVPVFVDPLVAVGYDYELGAGSPSIVQALFPTIAGDVDGYEIYALSDLTNPLFTGVLGGITVDFTTLAGFPGGIDGFALRGIDIGAALDPTDTTAFVTGLTFGSAGTVFLTQTPVTFDTAPVPEPASWAMMLVGFGGIGAAIRTSRRKRAKALAVA